MCAWREKRNKERDNGGIIKCICKTFKYREYSQSLETVPSPHILQDLIIYLNTNTLLLG